MNPELIQQGSRLFGAQCIVVAIDARNRFRNTRVNEDEAHSVTCEWDRSAVAVDDDTIWEVFIHGGRTATGIDAVKWASYVVARGAGEILLTSMDCDGTKTGYDVAMLAAVSNATTVPVIASGGAGTLEHFYIEFRVVLPKKGLRWRYCNSVPERMEDGSTLWHGIIIDIAHRKRSEEELLAAKEKAEESDRLKSAFPPHLGSDSCTLKYSVASYRISPLT